MPRVSWKCRASWCRGMLALTVSRTPAPAPGCRGADRVANRDFVNADVEQPHRHVGHARRMAIGPSKGRRSTSTRYPRTRSPAASASAQTAGIGDKRLVDRLVDVAPAERLRGRGEDRNLATHRRRSRARDPGGSAPARCSAPGPPRMPANTCAASAICGTHFGDTNADTSITRWPASDRRSTNAILSAALIGGALILQARRAVPPRRS